MKRLTSILQDYVAGDLDKQQSAAIEQRIEKEPRVRALHEEIVAAHNALTSLRKRPEPPVSAEDVLPRIHAAITSQRYSDRPELYMDGAGRRYYRRIALAATLLLAITVGLLVARNQGADTVEPNPLAEVGASEAAPSTDVSRILVNEAADGPLDALKVLKILERAGAKPDIEFSPNNGVLPVAEGLTEKR